MVCSEKDSYCRCHSWNSSCLLNCSKRHQCWKLCATGLHQLGKECWQLHFRMDCSNHNKYRPICWLGPLTMGCSTVGCCRSKNLRNLLQLSNRRCWCNIFCSTYLLYRCLHIRWCRSLTSCRSFR